GRFEPRARRRRLDALVGGGPRHGGGGRTVRGRLTALRRLEPGALAGTVPVGVGRGGGRARFGQGTQGGQRLVEVALAVGCRAERVGQRRRSGRPGLLGPRQWLQQGGGRLGRRALFGGLGPPALAGRLAPL